MAICRMKIDDVEILKNYKLDDNTTLYDLFYDIAHENGLDDSTVAEYLRTNDTRLLPTLMELYDRLEQQEID